MCRLKCANIIGGCDLLTQLSRRVDNGLQLVAAATPVEWLARFTDARKA
jgi:hypothetical protein